MVLFLHVKRIPTWQVDKQFWASVCVCGQHFLEHQGMQDRSI